MGVYRLLMAALVGYQVGHLVVEERLSPALRGLVRMGVESVPLLYSHLESSVVSVYNTDVASCVYSASVGQSCRRVILEKPTPRTPWMKPVYFGFDYSPYRIWETAQQRHSRLYKRCSEELACATGDYQGCGVHIKHYTGLCKLLHRNGFPLPPLRVVPGIVRIVETPPGFAFVGLSAVLFCVLVIRSVHFAITCVRAEYQPVRIIRRYNRYEPCPTVACPPMDKETTLAQSLRRAENGWTRWSHALRPRVEKVLVPFEVQLTADDWEFLHGSSYFILVPPQVQYHAHATVSAGLEGPALPPRIVWRGCSFQKVVFKDHTAEIVRYESAPMVMLPPKPLTKFTCGGRNFVENDHLVTMLDIGSTHESVPHDVLNTIGARLATDISDPRTLYDRAGSFFRSSCKSKNLRLSDHAPWIVLVLDRMNRAASIASGSVYVNMPFDASLLTRLTWRILRRFRSVNPLDQTPAPTDWKFENSFVPAYEVHAVKDRAVLNEPLRPEVTMPFQDVRPTTDATSGGGVECSASPDGRECSELDGATSAGATAHTEPAVDRVDTESEAGEHVLPSAPIAEPVCVPASPGPEPTGLGRGVDRRDSDGWGIDLAGPLDPTRNPISAFLGGVELHLVPIAARVGVEATVPRWDCIASCGGLLGGEEYARTIRLQSCFECASDALKFFRRLSPTASTGTAFGVLEKRLAAQNKKSSCLVCAQGLPPVRSCAPLRAEVLQQTVEAREQGERTDPLRHVGAEISRKKKNRTAQRAKARDRKRRAGESRRAGEVLPQE